jgi:predicted transcriptional regulator
MATLTFEIPDDMHAELLDAARERDIPLRDFLLTAISEEIDREKNRQEAEHRYAEYVRTGLAYSLEEVKEEFEKRIAGLCAQDNANY